MDSSSGPVGVSNNACGDHLYHDRRTSYPYDRRLLCMSSNGDLLSLVCSSLDDHHPLHESPRWRIGWVRHNVSNFLIHTVMSVSLSLLCIQSALLYAIWTLSGRIERNLGWHRTHSCRRPGTTSLWQRSPERPHPAARARVCPYIRDDDCEYDYYSSYAILFVGLRNKSEL